MSALRFLALGDAAVVVEFGSEARPGLAAQVLALDAAVRAEIQAGRLPGVVEAVPTLRSLALLYDARIARGRCRCGTAARRAPTSSTSRGRRG
jgi:allophanate hydrolase subunit 1